MFPFKKVKYNSYNLKPWITKVLLKSIERKNVLYKNFIKSPTTQNKKRFNTYRNKLTSLIRISKRWYINNKLEVCKNNMKETWGLLNGLLNKKQTKDNYPTQFKCNNSKDRDFYTIASKFGTFFSNIGQNLANEIPEVDLSYEAHLKGNYTDSLFFMPTTSREIESITALFTNKKSFSFDGISTNLIKASISEILVTLSGIINLSLQTGIVPGKLKIAKIIPLYKSGDNQSYCNYRPISFLPSLSKILERTAY